MTIKTFTLGLAIAAATLTASAAPVLAQPGYGPPHGPGPGYGAGPGAYGGWRGDWRSDRGGWQGDINARLDRIQNWINGAKANGRIPRDRAFHAQGELNTIRRYARGVFNARGDIPPRQHDYIESRINHLRDYIRDSGFRDF